MLTYQTFDDALKVCFQEHPQDFSMDFDAMENALIQSGLKTQRLTTTPASSTKNLLIECRHREKHFWHYLVFDASQNAFLDPIPNPPDINAYQFFRAIAIQN